MSATLYDWYKLFNKTEFEAIETPSRTLLVQLEGRGTVAFEVTKGNQTSITYDGTLLPVMFNDQNPYVSGDYAIYLDTNDDVWFGFVLE